MKYKKILDDRKCRGYLYEPLKACDCLNRELLVAKVEAYGFSKGFLLFIKSCINKRNQSLKVNISFSEWKEIDMCVQQGSELGPLLFDIKFASMQMMLHFMRVALTPQI